MDKSHIVINGPVVLGHIELPAVVSRKSRCECCGKRSSFGDVYIRDSGKQLCDDCDDQEHTLPSSGYWHGGECSCCGEHSQNCRCYR